MGERLVTLVTLAQRPDLEDALDAHNGGAWPEFMLHDPVAGDHWWILHGPLAAWQFMLLGGDDQILAAGNSAPLAWDGTVAGLPEGWDAQFRQSAAELAAGVPPNTLGALQIVVRPDLRGSGLAGRMVTTFRETARAAGFGAVIACVRPTDKHRYPLMPIERYAAWRRADGLPFDPWLRLHERLGGRIARPSPASMQISGSVGEWEGWTGMSFPESGPYVVPFATNPVNVDREADRVAYEDANIWVVHDLG